MTKLEILKRGIECLFLGHKYEVSKPINPFFTEYGFIYTGDCSECGRCGKVTENYKIVDKLPRLLPINNKPLN